jgi:predicted NAD-dependent protein-ADP-ribosyltransferase YbiA (DUF1768 family)
MNCSASSLASAARFSSRFILLAAPIVCGCHSSHPSAVAPAGNSTARDPRYPAEWWKPVADPKKPSWEILPQEAGPGEVILSKRNELGLLSNFAATPFEFHGKRYASLEGFWQAMKYPEGPDDPRARFPGIEWKHTRDEVAQMTAFDAKAAGDLGSRNMRTMEIDWVTFEGKQMPYRPGRGPEDETASESENPSQNTPDANISDPTKGEHYRLIFEATREKVRQNPDVQRVLLATGDLVLKPDHHQEPNPPAAWRYYEILSDIRREPRQQP